MNPISAVRFLQWSKLAKPACDRAIYQRMKKSKARAIVEIGLGDGTRAERIVQVAHKFGAGSNVKYTGIDLFDGRSDDQSELTLIEMHRRLGALGVKPQLVPGDLVSSMRRIANSHTRTDMIIVSAGYDPAALDASWFLIPRMLYAGSSFLIQDEFEGPFRVLSRLEIEQRVPAQAKAA